MKISFEDEPVVEEEVVVDFKKNVIQNLDGDDKIVNLYAVEAVD